MKIELHYSIENGGDGSAYPRWYASSKLADWHQDHLCEGWGEPCTGSIEVEGDNLICKELETEEGYFTRLLLDDYNESKTEAKVFAKEFFPDGLPKLEVDIWDEHYYCIFHKGQIVYKKFKYDKGDTDREGVKALQERIDKGI